jgi:hypothetical protein
MSAFTQRFLPRIGSHLAFALSVISSAAFAQTPTAPAPTVASAPARADVPDGAPELTAEKNVSNTSVTATGKASTSVIVEEERVQGRLANAHVRVGTTKGYTIVDPNAGRTDRQADNGGKRVNPSLWELFRF